MKAMSTSKVLNLQDCEGLSTEGKAKFAQDFVQAQSTKKQAYKWEITALQGELNDMFAKNKIPGLSQFSSSKIKGMTEQKNVRSLGSIRFIGNAKQGEGEQMRVQREEDEVFRKIVFRPVEVTSLRKAILI